MASAWPASFSLTQWSMKRSYRRTTSSVWSRLPPSMITYSKAG
jgi:hypothetical protein